MSHSELSTGLTDHVGNSLQSKNTYRWSRPLPPIREQRELGTGSKETMRGGSTSAGAVDAVPCGTQERKAFPRHPWKGGHGGKLLGEVGEGETPTHCLPVYNIF